MITGKRKLCYTEASDFTDIQGVGNDPIYKRYNSVYAVVRQCIDIPYRTFLAEPEYSIEDDQIYWYVDDWGRDTVPIKYSDLSDDEKVEYEPVFRRTVKYYHSAAQSLSGENLKILNAALKFINENFIYCIDGHVVLAIWGMTPDTHQYRAIGTIIHELDFVRTHRLTFDVGVNGYLENSLEKSVRRPEGAILSNIDLPKVKAKAGYIFVEWTPSPLGMKITSSLSFVAQYEKVQKDETELCESSEPPVAKRCHVRFVGNDKCTFNGITKFDVDCGSILSATQIPTVVANTGFKFKGWSDKIHAPIINDTTFTVQYDAIIPKNVNVKFLSGENGAIVGTDSLVFPMGKTMLANQIPFVKPKSGYKFVGWNQSPLQSVLDNDVTFTAQYEKKEPCWRKFWLWLTGTSYLTGLLRLLLFLLFLLLLLFLLRSCNGCTSWHEENGIVPIDSIATADGRLVDDNGCVKPITDNMGKLPEGDAVVAPVLDEDGEKPPIIEQPGVPNIIGNRLFLFLENESDNVDALAQDFKKAYPGEQYNIIGFDSEVKMLVIQIPEAERDAIRQTINQKIPTHKFLVFDEQIYELNGHVSIIPEDPGWHLKAIHLQEGWKITKGTSSVIIAVVDDGIQADHPIFKNRIVNAYNVFTQSNHLSLGEGHGTHTAGLAAGSAEFYAKGTSGVAPNCKLMPVQVFDNKQCPLSALIAGVMYAVHHDADVVNLSVGPSFNGLNQLPVEMQEQISHQQFKNMEILWKRVCDIAAKKKCILVFAAGNDDILSSIPPENRNLSSIVVAAVDKRLYPTDFTNYGPCSDISAPGKDIYSSFPTSTFQSCDGTSMAAPIVSGTIALMKSIRKDLTVEQARNALYSTGADVYGYIPPMVLVDKVLDITKRGDFSKPQVREVQPIPDGEEHDSSAGRMPIQEISQPGQDGVPSIQTPTEGSDYDAVRKLIREYEEKIKKLKDQLPENKKQ